MSNILPRFGTIRLRDGRTEHRWRNIPITLKTLNERNRLIYKRGCQEHFSPSAGCAGLFRDIQPLSPWKTLVWCPAPGLFHRSSCIFFSSDDADQFRNAFKPYGCRVATMDLSEARGLVLFRVVRRGIGITRRLSVTDTCAPTCD